MRQQLYCAPTDENSRREIAAHEARDPFSADAWDRVIRAITNSGRM